MYPKEAVLAMVTLAACTPTATDEQSLSEVRAHTSRQGDPVKGRVALLNNGPLGGEPYLNCGVPETVWKMVNNVTSMQFQTLPGRDENNAKLPYFLSHARSKAGGDVIAPNCLLCHAAPNPISGEILLGLGNSIRSFGSEDSVLGSLQWTALLKLLPAQLANSPVGLELARLERRARILSGRIDTSAPGQNPADTIFPLLAIHRDPKTLRWLDEGDVDHTQLDDWRVVPTDVPAWWNYRKRKTMFYGGFGKGDHARIMMTASLLCLESTEEAAAIDRYFGDIRAFVESLRPPLFPQAIDETLRDRGREIFLENCATCHGTYEKDNGYDEAFIAIDEVGTDALLTDYIGSARVATFIDWFNTSWFGTHRSGPRKPGFLELPKSASGVSARGYVAPPLDGVWVTAPYFHNGSVNSLKEVLNSKERPTCFSRSTVNYDLVDVGWHVQACIDCSCDGYQWDTHKPGMSNKGHPFGDSLTAVERFQLIEYLKSL